MAENSKAVAGQTDLWGDPWVEPRDPRGRKRHKRCEQVAESIEQSRADGMTIDEIVVRVGLSEPTLRHYYLPELKYGARKAKARFIKALFEKAESGNVAAIKLALQVIEKGEAAVPVSSGARQAKEPAEPKLGKKAAADADAQVAHKGTEWGSLLQPRPH